MKRIVTFGPGPKFKGGIANYNTSLALALDKHEDVEVHIVSWITQYPAIIPRDFIDRKSRRNPLSGSRITVHYLIDYNRPGSWQKTVQFIRDLKPEMVILQWAITIQGIPMRYVAKRLQKSGIKVCFDLHNVSQKEHSNLDQLLTRKCIRFSDSYIIHSRMTFQELKALLPDRDLRLISEDRDSNVEGVPVLKLYHPVYDIFQRQENFDAAALKKKLGLKKHVFLFFGFIRRYKGLHNVIEAFQLVCKDRDDVSLLIVGELFWNTLDRHKLTTRLKNNIFSFVKKLLMKEKDDEREYRPLDLISKYGLEKNVVCITEFVPNEDVHKYFQVSDAIVLFYMMAAPSGVGSIALNFGLPILATTVEPFPETVKDGYNGYLAEPEDTSSMADVMIRAIESPIPRENVYATSAEMSWDNYASAILKH